VRDRVVVRDRDVQRYARGFRESLRLDRPPVRSVASGTRAYAAPAVRTRCPPFTCIQPPVTIQSYPIIVHRGPPGRRRIIKFIRSHRSMAFDKTPTVEKYRTHETDAGSSR